MPIIQQIINQHPTVVGQPGTDLSTIDFSDATGEVRYRIHLSSLKPENIRNPFQVLNPTVGLNFTLPMNQYLTMWTDKPFYASSDSDISGIDYWEPDYGEDPISPAAPLTNPFDLDLLTEADAGPVDSNTNGITFTPGGDTELTSAEILSFTQSAAQDATLQIIEGADMNGVVIFNSPSTNVGTIKTNNVFDLNGSPRLTAGQTYTLKLSRIGANTTFIMREEGLDASNLIGSITAPTSVSVVDSKLRLVGVSS